MSTRSQLRFIQRIEYENDDGEVESTTRIAQVYRHSDGYPSGVLPSLAQLKNLQNVTGTERDPSYVAANFIFLGKLQGMGLYIGRDRDDRRSITPEDIVKVASEGDLAGLVTLRQPLFLLGYGVEDPADGIHGDEEYLYIVELPPRGPHDEPGDWNVKVSSHCGFPRWDGPTEKSFDRATWQFEGTLTEALETFLSNTA